MASRVMEWDGDIASLQAWIEQWVTGPDGYSIHPQTVMVLVNGTMGAYVRAGDRLVDTRAVDGYPGISVVNGDAHD